MIEVLEAVSNARRPLIFGHVNPDPDCIGSLVVMATALRRLGKESGLVLPENTVSHKYRFLLELADPPAPIDEPDLLIVLDTAMVSRINKPKGQPLPDAPIGNIDHHLGNERFGRYNWIDTTAASACQMVFSLLEKLGAQLTGDQSTLLYAGLHTDTCGFSLASTDAHALTVGARLASLGARIGWVCQKLHRSLRWSEFKLMQVVYNNTRISPCGRFAWSTVTLEEMSAIGATPLDIDEQVAIPRSIEGVRIAALFSETRSGRIRINLRAEDEINILPLARRLGGGGHAQAAGAVQEGPFEQIIDAVRNEAIRYLDDPVRITPKNPATLKS